MSGPYASITDLKKFIPEYIIVQLTDDFNTNTIETEITDDCIDQAGNMIDTYMRGRYPYEMDTTDVPAFINDMAVKIACYNLYRRKLSLTMPDPIRDCYKEALQMLKDIQSGKLTPWEAVSEPIVIKTNKVTASRTYSPTVWDTYPIVH